MVKTWFAEFKRGRINTDDAERSGRPNSAVVPLNIKKVHKIILADCKLKLQWQCSLFTILHEHFVHEQALFEGGTAFVTHKSIATVIATMAKLHELHFILLPHPPVATI